MASRGSISGMGARRASASGVSGKGYIAQNSINDMQVMQNQPRLPTSRSQQQGAEAQGQQPQSQDKAAQQQQMAQRRQSRGSISGTSYGKPGMDQPLAAPPPTVQDRRASKRMSRLSKLSDVSEAESDKSRPVRNLSVTGMSFTDTVAEDDSVQPLPTPGRRMSRRLSVADDFAAESERRRSRRLSLMSTGSTASRMSRTERAKNDWVQGPETGELPRAWADDYKNPVNWSYQTRILNSIVSCIIAFAYSMTITAYGPSIRPSQEDLNLTSTLAVVPYALFALGLIFGHSLSTPFVNTYGRRVVLLVTIPLFAGPLVGAGFVDSPAGLILLRFASGLFASPGLFICYSIISDMWITSRHSFPVAYFALSIVAGAFAGPLVTGIALQYENWRWAMWIPCFTVIVLLFGVVGSSETEKSIIIRKAKTAAQKQAELEQKRKIFLERKEKKLPPLPKEKNFRFRPANVLLEPFKYLATQPRHLLSSIYAGYVFAVVVALPIVIPAQFAAAHAYDSQKRGLTWIGALVGAVIAVLLAFLVDRYMHQPRVEQWVEEQYEAFQEKGVDERRMTNRESGIHSSWRKGLQGLAPQLELNIDESARNSMVSSTPRSGSDSSAAGINSNRNSTGSRPSRRSRLQAFSERNINIAIVATRYLNSVPGNANNKVIVERVMVLLKDNESYTGICAALETLGLEFEESLLAKVMEDALKKEKKGASDIALARSKSLHRLAAQAALMGPTDSSGDEASPTSSTNKEKDAIVDEPTRRTPSVTAEDDNQGPVLERPPPEWRYIPALPATILLPASLFWIGWTLKPSVAAIVPVVGMGLWGFSTCVLVWASTAFGMELFSSAAAARCTPSDARGEQDAAHALRAGSMLVTFVLATAFALFVRPMYDALGFAWGTSVLGFVGVGLGAVPWVLMTGSRALRGRTIGSGEEEGEEQREAAREAGRRVGPRRIGEGIERDERGLPTVPKALAG